MGKSTHYLLLIAKRPILAVKDQLTLTPATVCLRCVNIVVSIRILGWVIWQLSQLAYGGYYVM
jgi:hypothetical protein